MKHIRNEFKKAGAAAVAAAGFASAILLSSTSVEAQSLQSGPYIGAHLGYARAHAGIKDGGTNIINPPYGAFSCGPALTGNYCAVPFKLDTGGVVAGVQLGYNWRTGSRLLGIEADLGWLGIDGDKTLLRPFDDRDFAAMRLGAYGTLTARAGYDIGGAMLYAKGGLAVAQIKMNAADIDFNGASFAVYEPSRTTPDVTRLGWALGAGIERAISPTVTLKAEYLYMNFGSFKSGSADGDIYKHTVDVHTARIGINFALGQ